MQLDDRRLNTERHRRFLRMDVREPTRRNGRSPVYPTSTIADRRPIAGPSDMPVRRWFSTRYAIAEMRLRMEPAASSATGG